MGDLFKWLFSLISFKTWFRLLFYLPPYLILFEFQQIAVLRFHRISQHYFTKFIVCIAIKAIYAYNNYKLTVQCIALHSTLFNCTCEVSSHTEVIAPCAVHCVVNLMRQCTALNWGCFDQLCGISFLAKQHPDALSWVQMTLREPIRTKNFFLLDIVRSGLNPNDFGEIFWFGCWWWWKSWC